MRSVVASLLLLSACSGPSNPPSTPEAHLDRAAVTPPPEAFVDVDRCVTTTSVVMEPATATTLTEIDSLTVIVALNRVCRAEAGSIELWTPGGSAFEVRSAGFNGGKELRFRFPVSGAAIQQRGLDGTWQVRTLLDGAVVANATSFDLAR